MKKSIMTAIIAVVSATSWAQFQGPEGGPGDNQGHHQGSMEGRGGKSSMPPPNPTTEK